MSTLIGVSDTEKKKMTLTSQVIHNAKLLTVQKTPLPAAEVLDPQTDN